MFSDSNMPPLQTTFRGISVSRSVGRSWWRLEEYRRAANDEELFGEEFEEFRETFLPGLANPMLCLLDIIIKTGGPSSPLLSAVTTRSLEPGSTGGRMPTVVDGGHPLQGPASASDESSTPQVGCTCCAALLYCCKFC